MATPAPSSPSRTSRTSSVITISTAAIIVQDAIDLKASVPEYNPIKKTQISCVDQLIIDKSRVDPAVGLSRLANFPPAIVIDEKLAEEIQSEGFVGPDFGPVEEVTG